MAGSGASGPTHQRMASDIWSVADLLRGNYMRHEYGEIILPLTVLRRLDAVMAQTRQAVWDRDAVLTGQGIQNKERPLELAAKLPFYNTSQAGLRNDRRDAPQVAKNLRDYIAGFSENVQEDHRALRPRQPDHPAGRSEDPVPGRRPLRRRCGTWKSCPPTTWATSSSI